MRFDFEIKNKVPNFSHPGFQSHTTNRLFRDEMFLLPYFYILLVLMIYIHILISDGRAGRMVANQLLTNHC
jgi:hypothetical protein